MIVPHDEVDAMHCRTERTLPSDCGDNEENVIHLVTTPVQERHLFRFSVSVNNWTSVFLLFFFFVCTAIMLHVNNACFMSLITSFHCFPEPLLQWDNRPEPSTYNGLGRVSDSLGGHDGEGGKIPTHLGHFCPAPLSQASHARHSSHMAYRGMCIWLGQLSCSCIDQS
jgi:hypothetical protein